MGDQSSPYEEVMAFYNYWLKFSSIMDFSWVSGPDASPAAVRRIRRDKTEYVRTVRKKAKRKYDWQVRNLARFVMKRDKRIIDWDVKRREEAKMRCKEEQEKKEKLERERSEQTRMYQETKCQTVAEEEEEEEEEGAVEEGQEKQELYCVACRRKFRSEKQWKNHEQSRKHKATMLRKFSLSDEILRENEEVQDRLNKELKAEKGDGKIREVAASHVIDELSEEKDDVCYRVNIEADTNEEEEEEEEGDDDEGLSVILDMIALYERKKSSGS